MLNTIFTIILSIICSFVLITNIYDLARLMRDDKDGIFISRENAIIQHIIMILISLLGAALVFLR